MIRATLHIQCTSYLNGDRATFLVNKDTGLQISPNFSDFYNLYLWIEKNFNKNMVDGYFHYTLFEKENHMLETLSYLPNSLQEKLINHEKKN